MYTSIRKGPTAQEHLTLPLLMLASGLTDVGIISENFWQSRCLDPAKIDSVAPEALAVICARLDEDKPVANTRIRSPDYLHLATTLTYLAIRHADSLPGRVNIEQIVTKLQKLSNDPLPLITLANSIGMRLRLPPIKRELANTAAALDQVLAVTRPAEAANTQQMFALDSMFVRLVGHMLAASNI